jgi:hypothetical protein
MGEKTVSSKNLWGTAVLALLFYNFFLPLPLNAQSSSEQFWVEHMLNYSFANSFNLENAFTYSTDLHTPRWSAFDYAPTLEYSVGPHLDLSLGATFSYTVQSEDYNTFEIRPVLGTRVHFTPNKRILTRVYFRIEQRNVKNLDTKDWETTLRPRARIEALIPISKKSYYVDKLWYGIVDAEWFFTNDPDVDERFANRFRSRIGLGYRLHYGSRFEFLVMYQESKNNIEDTFYTSDSIFRLRYKHFLRRHKPTKLGGTGN